MAERRTVTAEVPVQLRAATPRVNQAGALEHSESQRGGFDCCLIHVNEKPYVVAVTFFDGHQIPMVEMWTKPPACPDAVQTYPYWRFTEPRWASEEERSAAWLTAQRHVATFTEGK